MTKTIRYIISGVKELRLMRKHDYFIIVGNFCSSKMFWKLEDALNFYNKLLKTI